MAGRIRQADVEELKHRVNIADVVADYVTLKSAGVGSMKGLCPFHDERSPSFHVRPQVGYYHCFGCGESGDVYSFVQKMDHLTFTEAIERLAQRINFELHYEEGSSASSEGANRTRILAANSAAAAFFVTQLATPGAAEARKFLGQRGFDKAAAEQFGLGYAPKAWSDLKDHLKSLGFSKEEMMQAGLLSQGDKGAYDRFRGRVVWPIRDTTGQTIGFGARKLYEDDQGPKYLNTPETPVYHKAQVLYGLDVAKRDIAKSRQVVVVEGYTDVMAAHLSGVTTAVATCGTSFGVDHIKLIRRIMGDDSGLGEVIFTFDPDAAGQKAAMRAFAEEQRFAAQTYVAVAPDGLDPCDLRLAKGEQAVRDLMEAKVPMFEFVMRQILSRYNLDTVEGRVAALREAAPVVADIRDAALRPGYTRELARLTGVDVSEATTAVSQARKNSRSQGMSTSPSGVREGYAGVPESVVKRENSDSAQQDVPVVFDLKNDPSTRLEKEALMAIIQFPHFVGKDLASDATQAVMMDSNLATIRDVIGANMESFAGDDWIDQLHADIPPEFKPLLTQLAVTPLPQREAAQAETYCKAVVISLVERDLVRRKSELVGRLQRTPIDQGEVSREIQRELLELETQRRALRGDE